MARKAKNPFTDAALSEALTRTPNHLTREGRVKLIGEVSLALLAGKKPSREAALFVGGAMQKWLHTGGSLERDCLKVVKAKSKHTASYLWRQMQAEAARDPGADDAA